jgi:hypothetical protein
VKANLITAALVGIIGAFSAYGETSSWLEAGSMYSRTIENYSYSGKEQSTALNSLDLVLAWYQFSPNSRLGWFAHAGFLFPVSGTLMQDKTKSPASSASYNWLVGIESIDGLAFRTPLGSMAWLTCGIGLSVSLQFGDYEIIHPSGVKSTATSTNLRFGIGSDVGVVLTLNSRLMLKIGTSITHSVVSLNWPAYNAAVKPSYVDSYSAVVLSPYLAIGINFDVIDELGKAELTRR